MGKLDGHCLCGEVTYTVANEDPVITGICHCTECRRQSGAAWSIVVAVSRDEIEITGDSLRTFDTIGDDTRVPVHRQFCGNCGSPIVSLAEWAPELAFIKAGTLEDASWLEPELEAWCESALPWALDTSREDRGYFPRGLDTEGADEPSEVQPVSS
ncbi:MAG: hypothetical protein JWN32_3367 [Solirubrobacterales bacterium]|jgi:hypothetical protein|nr:hypothetical protein [Solirubrobacterales bacterium]